MLDTESPAYPQIRNYRRLLDGERSLKIEHTDAPIKKSKRYIERRREILEAALESFGDRGTEISLQGLSQQLKVSQPLIHRYFPTKADLLAAIKEALQIDHWSEAFTCALRDRSVPIEKRLANFYAAYLPSTSRRRWIRSFEFAALSDESFAQNYLGRVENEVIYTIAHETRVTLGYPESSDYTPSSRELEAVWGMHSAIMLWVSRRYAYKTSTTDAIEVLVSDQAFAYLALAKHIQLELYGEA
nr:TetR/AcrR family transcriptional regulator [Pseudomonas taiwanensis]